MCCWAGSSRALRVVAVTLLLLGWSGAASSKVFLTVDEALRLAFAGSKVQRRTAYLTKEQVKRAAELSGEEVASALVTYYQGPGGFAYFDTHRVRTLPETLMVMVDPQGQVKRIEVISFREPEEYMPRGNWYGQFQGRKLDRNLRIKTGIPPVTGATLTVRATTGAVRRVLALHQVIFQGSEGRKTP